MNLASSGQRRKIFLLAKQMDMDSDLLHSYIHALVGKDSIRKLTIREAIRVIDGLSGENQKDTMSQAQKSYLIFLAKRVGWVNRQGELAEERLNGFCRKEYHVLYWTSLTKKNAGKAIEALKSMAERGDENERATGAAVGES